MSKTTWKASYVFAALGFVVSENSEESLPFSYLLSVMERHGTGDSWEQWSLWQKHVINELTALGYGVDQPISEEGKFGKIRQNGELQASFDFVKKESLIRSSWYPKLKTMNYRKSKFLGAEIGWIGIIFYKREVYSHPLLLILGKICRGVFVDVTTQHRASFLVFGDLWVSYQLGIKSGKSYVAKFNVVNKISKSNLHMMVSPETNCAYTRTITKEILRQIGSGKGVPGKRTCRVWAWCFNSLLEKNMDSYFSEQAPHGEEKDYIIKSLMYKDETNSTEDSETTL